MLADRTVENMRREIPAWVRHVLSHTYGYFVRGLRDDWEADIPEEPARYAFTAAKCGYEARSAEFAFLEQDSSNALARLQRSPDHDETLLGAVVQAASTMMNASHQAPNDPDYSQYLTPVGAGHDLHARVFAILTGSLLGEEDGQLRQVPGIYMDELGLCMRYGYYVHACGSSLPDEARAELESVEQERRSATRTRGHEN